MVLFFLHDHSSVKIIFSYSFPNIKRNKQEPENSLSVSITTIILPSNVESFNTGSSLEKWAKKRPRLKSGAKTAKSPTEDDREFCYETLETDLSLLFNGLEEDNKSIDDSLSNLQYQVHTDIEQLILKGEISKDKNEPTQKPKRRRKKHGTDQKEGGGKAKQGRNKARTIVFSISKPPTPQTEQVIRVDVTSNVSIEEFRHAESNVDDCGLQRDKMIDGKRKELKRNFNENAGMDEENFIVRCKQLAPRQRQRPQRLL